MKQIWTDEEKAAKKIADVISDLRLDATLVGDALGVSQPVQILNRLVNMVDGMYVSRERFRQALGEEPTDINALPQIDEGNYDIENATPFMTRCEILGELYIQYKNDVEYEDFITYNDLGLPLAYAISINAVKPELSAVNFVNETWDLFLELEMLEDLVFESLDEIIDVDEDEYYEDEEPNEEDSDVEDETQPEK